MVAAYRQIPLNPPFSKGEVVGMPPFIEVTKLILINNIQLSLTIITCQQILSKIFSLCLCKTLRCSQFQANIDKRSENADGYGEVRANQIERFAKTYKRACQFFRTAVQFLRDIVSFLWFDAIHTR
ncbi:MAG: hypothetical protein J7L69_09120 [Desulfobulbaceae bacterium]|nr:hypothetical protein [Desulfobulbaceae bacterium]